jgi:uncharacterized SAM-binding protein YcdF (DUF218 family)
MLDNLAELYKTLLVPGSATFFLFGLLLGTIFLFSGRQLALWGRRLLLALAILGYLISTPLVASSLVRLLSMDYEPLNTEASPPNIDAVVILGGGGSTFRMGKYNLEMLSTPTSLRMLEGVRLYEELSPEWIIVSGGTNDHAGVSTPESETMASHLVEMGVPVERILIEGDSSNTRDQAINIPPILASHDVAQYVLVTSPTHMRRADLSFRAVSSQHLTSIAPISTDTKPELGWSPLPSADALDTSQNVFRELVGLLYYLLRGWI